MQSNKRLNTNTHFSLTECPMKGKLHKHQEYCTRPAAVRLQWAWEHWPVSTVAWLYPDHFFIHPHIHSPAFIEHQLCSRPSTLTPKEHRAMWNQPILMTISGPGVIDRHVQTMALQHRLGAFLLRKWLPSFPDGFLLRGKYPKFVLVEYWLVYTDFPSARIPRPEVVMDHNQTNSETGRSLFSFINYQPWLFKGVSIKKFPK
jgi:hypothetical protein